MKPDTDSIAWHAVKALIEDAKSEFKGPRGEAFAWAIYNAVRQTGDSQIQNLRELLHKHSLVSSPLPEGKGSWVN